MEYWILIAVIQLLLAPFTYKHYQQVLSSPPQPKKKRVLQSDKYKSQQAVTPLSKQGLKPSRPTTEPLAPGVRMVGGKAVLGLVGNYGISHNSSITSIAASYPSLVVVKRGSPDNGGGTWLHPDLALQLARVYRS